MKYRNTKTGAVIESPCEIFGGGWVLMAPAPAPAKAPAQEEKQEEKPKRTRKK